MLWILGLSLLLKVVLLVPAHSTRPVRDGADYYAAAASLYRGAGYTSLRAPLYPLTLYASMQLGSVGQDPTQMRRWPPGWDPPARTLPWVRILQVLMSTLSVALMYGLARELFDHRAGLAAAALFAFYPPLVGFSHLIWADTQFTLLNLAWAWLLVRGTRRGSLKLLACAGVCFALAALTRQVIFNFFPLALLYVLLNHPQSWRRALALCAAMALTLLAVVGPWTLRNRAVHGSWVPIAPNYGHALLWGASQKLGQELERAGISAWTPGLERDQRARARALEIIREDPAGYVKRMFTRNLPGLWKPGSDVIRFLRTPNDPRPRAYPAIPNWTAQGIVLFIVGGYLLALATGIVGLAAAPNWRETVLFIAIPLHAMALHAIASGQTRHRLYLMAFLLIYAGFLISRRRDELRALWTPARTAGALVGLIVMGTLVSVSDWASLAVQWRALAAGLS